MPLPKISFSRLFAAAVAVLLLLIALTLMVNYYGMFGAFDNSILQFIYGARGQMLTKIFLAFTFLGDSAFIFSMTVSLAVLLFYKKRLALFFLFLGIMFGNAVFAFLLKILTHRERPTFSPLVTEDSFSFPSGHAALSTAFFGLLAYLGASSRKTQVARISIFFLWIFVVAGIGFSRLYLGVHYPTDIIAGYLIGLFFFCIGIGLFEQFSDKTR